MKCPVILCLSGLDSIYLLVNLIESGHPPDVVLMAIDGNEGDPLIQFIERSLFPLIRQHHIRVVQISRTSWLKDDGVTVLQDTTQPATYSREVPLSVERALTSRAVLYPGPGYLKDFIGWPLQRWIMDNYAGYTPLVILGLRTGEEHLLASELSGMVNSQYWRIMTPFIEWGVPRYQVIQALVDRFGSIPARHRIIPTGRERFDDLIDLYRRQPSLAARPLCMEYVGRAVNPLLTHGWRVMLNSTLRQTLNVANCWQAELMFQEYMDSIPWTTYLVRRIRSDSTQNRRMITPSSSGICSRHEAVERIKHMHDITNFDQVRFHLWTDKDFCDTWRLWHVRKSRQEIFSVAAPNLVDTIKPKNFEVLWQEAAEAIHDD